MVGSSHAVAVGSAGLAGDSGYAATARYSSVVSAPKPQPSPATHAAAPRLAGLAYTQAMVTNHDFAGADLRGARLAHLDLRGEDFEHADAAGAVFTGSLLNGADFAQADLRGADLRDTCLRGSILTGASLAGADFTGADSPARRFHRSLPRRQ